MIEREKVTVFGTSARYLLACEKSLVHCSDAKNRKNLKSLRSILSTGSPLLPEQFDYVYKNISSTACLSSISGGTDIVSCFALGATTEPVIRGRLQVKGLGMDIAAVSDSGDELVDEPGELVCRKPFPSAPLYFWNDPQGEKYFKSYFSKFKNIWHHGDWCEFPSDGGVIIHGRSDATLNPGGVRIGTAEIYRVVETFPEIKECIAVGQNFGGSERIILFIVLLKQPPLAPAIPISEKLTQKIKLQLRKMASPRHVPAKIVSVPDLPRTLSGKAVEIAVRRVIHGKEVPNLTALANPEALKYFKDLEEIQS